jgi:hypothetical protein
LVIQRKTPFLAAVLASVAALTISMPAAAATGGGRVYEIVSPYVQGTATLPLGRPTADGSALAFQSLGLADGEASDKLNTYVARRGPTGWMSVLETPPALMTQPFELYLTPRTPTFAFSDDLTRSLFAGIPESTIVPGEPANARNLYMRDGDRIDVVTDRAPTPTGISWQWRAQPRVAWTTQNLEHVLFDSAGESASSGITSRAEYYPGVGRGVYLWSRGGDMDLVSIMPDGSTPDTASAGSGPMHEQEPGALYTGTWGGEPHALSEDTSRIYFTSPGALAARHYGQLHVRKDHGTPQAETIRLDKPEADAPPPLPGWPGGSRFWTATADGHKALFSNCAKLTADSTAVYLDQGCRNYLDTPPYTPTAHNKPDLYLWNEDANGGAGDLVDISLGDPDGADVLGVLGTSEDLTRVYFAARGNLTGDAQDGMPNLYLWEEGEGLTYIATLRERSHSASTGDHDGWRPPIGDGTKNAEVTADGRFVAFTTAMPIDADFDNVAPGTNTRHKQVYLWEIGDDEPTCVSCVGGPPEGDSGLVTPLLDARERSVPVYPDWDKRNLLADGRVFFEAGHDLVATDRNNRVDVYEYDPADGSLTLISSGNSTRPSHFVNATPDGRSVFFRTEESLVAWDNDGNGDIYDARLESDGFPPPPQPPTPCSGPICTPQPSQLFDGPADPQPEALGAFAIKAITAGQRRRLARTGRIVLRVTVPRAGKARARVLARLAKRKGARRRAVARRTVTAARPQTVRVPLRVGKKARKALKRGKRLRLTVQVRFDTTVRSVGLVVQDSRRRNR